MKFTLLEIPGGFSRNFALHRVRVMSSGIFAIISDGNFSPLLVLGNCPGFPDVCWLTDGQTEQIMH